MSYITSNASLAILIGEETKEFTLTLKDENGVIDYSGECNIGIFFNNDMMIKTVTATNGVFTLSVTRAELSSHGLWDVLIEAGGVFYPSDTLLKIRVEGVVENKSTSGSVNGDGPSGGGSGSIGTDDYALLNNKPRINGIELIGNKTAGQLRLAYAIHTHSYEDLEDLITEEEVEQIWNEN